MESGPGKFQGHSALKLKKSAITRVCEIMPRFNRNINRARRHSRYIPIRSWILRSLPASWLWRVLADNKCPKRLWLHWYLSHLHKKRNSHRPLPIIYFCLEFLLQMHQENMVQEKLLHIHWCIWDSAILSMLEASHQDMGLICDSEDTSIALELHFWSM